MSTLVDVPACLFAVLSLAASGADATRLGDIAQVTVDARDAAAGGPFLISDALWLPAWKAAETVDGLALPPAPRVYVTSSGHYYVPGEGAREQLLALRRDPDVAKRVAFGFAKRNAGRMEVALGRPAQAAELYMAHRFGAETAASFIAAAAEQPAATLASVAPDVARLAPDLARDGKGPATVAHAYERLVEGFAAARPAGFELAEAPPGVPFRLSLIDGLGAGLVIAMREAPGNALRKAPSNASRDAPANTQRDTPPAASIARPWSANVAAARN